MKQVLDTVVGVQEETQAVQQELQETKSQLLREIGEAKKDAANVRLAAATLKDDIFRVQRSLEETQNEAKQALLGTGDEMRAAIASLDKDQNRLPPQRTKSTYENAIDRRIELLEDRAEDFAKQFISVNIDLETQKKSHVRVLPFVDVRLSLYSGPGSCCGLL